MCVCSIDIRVQAENLKNSLPTFLKAFDPTINLLPFFQPPGAVFTYLIGLLGREPWPPLGIPPSPTDWFALRLRNVC